MTKEEMKQMLEQGWKEVFQLEEVSDDTDFFDEGGDSIKAVQLSSWLVQKGVKLDLADLFATPKLGELAEKLKETPPMYIPDALLTKEVGIKEMRSEMLKKPKGMPGMPGPMGMPGMPGSDKKD